MGKFYKIDKNNSSKKEMGYEKNKQPCFGFKKSSIKPKVRTVKVLPDDTDLLDQSITIRLSPTEVKRRVLWLNDNFPYCQVCGTSYNLGYPHHALDGNSRKDDRTMISICQPCHSHIHTKGYDGLFKTRIGVEKLGWKNNKKYLWSKK